MWLSIFGRFLAALGQGSARVGGGKGVGEEGRRSFLKKRTKKLSILCAERGERPRASERSFFASFCSQKEDSFLPALAL